MNNISIGEGILVYNKFLKFPKILGIDNKIFKDNNMRIILPKGNDICFGHILIKTIHLIIH